MAKKLWKFTDKSGSFESVEAFNIRSLYLPLCNDRIMSSITPDLHGDIKVSDGAFLLEPVSRINLSTSRASRNFWIRTDKGAIWSAAGVSKDLKQLKKDKTSFRAGLLWQQTSRENTALGLKAEILSFVPAGNLPCEIMQVTITNISRRKIKLTPFAAIPMYCRGTHNLRDHRHVTSLLQRITLHKFGIISKPTLSFDEKGHQPNKDRYFVLGWDQNGKPAANIYPTQDIFCGDSGDLEAPQAVITGALTARAVIQGREPMGGLRFKEIVLSKGKSQSYIIVMGITQDKNEIKKITSGCSTTLKVESLFKKTRDWWIEQSNKIALSSGDADFDNWLRWVNTQPLLRRIFGCSFLPDFDYGKGGRGWRDLWQDCLALILNDPAPVREILINSFAGVRIDGSNATIIGKGQGEFISDRNNISRTWMDHGVWPLLTVDLYINETGDTGILFEEAPYFRNHEISRARERDAQWDESCGTSLKDKTGKVYRASVLEHLLVQNLVQFFNVGEHNYTRLEGADWNDGLDMARDRGESVAFSAMYAHNLQLLAQLLLRLKTDKIEIAQELLILLERFDYNDRERKLAKLGEYFRAVNYGVSGEKASQGAAELSDRLKGMGEWLATHIRSHEWLEEGYFNGYYDNDGQRLEGKNSGVLRMTLTGQVFAIMSGVASDEQVDKSLSSIKKYLVDKKTGGFRLNTDFKEECHKLGRAFSFSYGDKENGAFFSHMTVMLAYALFKRDRAREAWQALSSIYGMARDSSRSKIYPCLPEYFDLEGRGMYSYLTGSASWFMLTLLTRLFGVRGQDGDLLIEPRLVREHFKDSGVITLKRIFAGRRLSISFHNPKKADWPDYRIQRASLNGKELAIPDAGSLLIKRLLLEGIEEDKETAIDLYLG